MACKKCEENMRTKVRDDSEHRDLINRLRRIEGQIRGIEGMIDNDAYCTDVLTQVVAVRSAMGSFARVLLSKHLKSCVCDDIRQGNDETVDELVELLGKMIK